MRIALAADHGGFAAKERLLAHLRAAGHEVQDFGTTSEASCDYPDHGVPAARSVSEGRNDRAVLVCTTGIGMSMLANRLPGVRASLVYSRRTAELTRRHNDANVLCLGAGEFPHEDLVAFADTWLATPFEGGRHQRRVDKFPSTCPGC